MPQSASNDLFLEDKDGFTNVDFSQHPEDRELEKNSNPFLQELANIANEELPAGLSPENIGNRNPNFTGKTTVPQEPEEVDGNQEQPVQQAPVAAPSSFNEPEEEQPERIEIDDDGSYAVLEYKSGKGWFAHVFHSTGGKEVFKGSTKNELIRSLIVGKANATKKIRQLNKQVKLGVQQNDEEAVEQPTRPKVTVRDLTPDEIFDLKNKMESNPGDAIETYVQKKYGYTLEQIIESGQLGKSASQELDSEAVANEFMRRFPDYNRTRDSYLTILAYLSKNKLNKTLTNKNEESIITEVINRGFWTVKNLSEAFEDLKDQDLIETATLEETDDEEINTPPVRTQATQPVSEPSTNDSRIVRQTRRPRAGLGIKPSSIPNTPVSSGTTGSPSVEDLEQLPDNEVNELWNNVRKLKLKQNRR